MAGSSSSKNQSSNEQEKAFEEFITHYDDSSDEEVFESFEEQPAALLTTFESKAKDATWEQKREFPLAKITKENLYGNYLGRKLLYCKEVQDRYYEVKHKSFPALVFDKNYDKTSVIRNFENWVEECLITTFTKIYSDLQQSRFRSFFKKSGSLNSSEKAKLHSQKKLEFINVAAKDPRKFYRKFFLSQSVTSKNWEKLETLLKELFDSYIVLIKTVLLKSTSQSQLESFIMKYEIKFKKQELLEKHFIHMRNTANEGISSFENRENAVVTVRTANRLARRAIKNNTGFANEIPLPVFHVFKYQFSPHSSSAAIEIEEINKNLARVSHVKSVRSYYLIPGMINIVKETLNSFHENKGYNDQDIAYWIELCLKGKSFDNWPKLDEKEGTASLKPHNSKLIGCLQFVSALTTLLFYVEPKRNPSAFVYNLLILDLVKNGKREWWACFASVKPEEVDNHMKECLKKRGGSMPMSKVGATCLSRWIHNAFNIPKSGLGNYNYEGPLNSYKVTDGIKPNLEIILQKETNLVKEWLLANKTADNFDPIKALLTEFYLNTSSVTKQMADCSLTRV